ncbi:related to allantoate permease [Ustilago bromivora]|uniref:Related to allantoate permease n=1 Tax=Ustilago bromivora TaxID=307758 RepID=A0A1K0G205_9BASI|nr:related to allantoate permease [Ustilago bromivora]SYW80607.1 related to allantoate permease [Ustilago bromivora]
MAEKQQTPDLEGAHKLAAVQLVTTDASILDKESIINGKLSQNDIAVLPNTIIEEADEEVLKYTDASVTITPEENKRLRRKIDKRVLTIMLGTYFCQSLDKQILSFAAIMGIRTDLKLKGQEYSWLFTCLYLAILCTEGLQNYLVQRLPINRWLGFCVTAWGISCCFVALCHDFTGILVLRIMLGCFECVCQPAFVALSAIWYRKEEQARTITLWYCCNGLQAMFGGLLGFAFYHIQGAALASWRIMFLVLGLLTVIWGCAIVYILPISPMKARGFTEEERTKVVERVRENQTGVQNRKFKMDHVWEAVKDPQMWALFLINLLNTIPTGGLGSYGNIIIKTNLGFSVLQTNLLGLAQGAFQILVLLAAAWVAKKWNQTILTAVLFTLPNIISAVLFLTIPNTKEHAGGLLFAFYMTICIQAQATLSFSLLSRNVAGQTKRAVVTTATFVGWAAGNSAGPQLFQDKDAPLYRPAFFGQLGCYVASILVLLALRFYYMDQNRRKRRATNVLKGRAEDAEDQIDYSQAFLDLTDKKNINFRYSY